MLDVKVITLSGIATCKSAKPQELRIREPQPVQTGNAVKTLDVAGPRYEVQLNEKRLPQVK